MRVLNYILGMTSDCTSIRMNEADPIFAKEGSLVEVPYVEPSFWKVLMSSPWFQGLIPYERMMWTTWYDMCNALCAACKMISMMMHVTLIAWLSQSKFGKYTYFPNPNLANPLTWLSIIHIDRREIFLLVHVLGVFLYIPIHSTSVY